MLVPMYRIVRLRDHSPIMEKMFNRSIDAENYIKEHHLYPGLVIVVQVFDFIPDPSV